MSVVTKELDKEGESNQKQEDENEAVLAFSNQLPGNEDAPVAIQVDEK